MNRETATYHQMTAPTYNQESLRHLPGGSGQVRAYRPYMCLLFKYQSHTKVTGRERNLLRVHQNSKAISKASSQGRIVQVKLRTLDPRRGLVMRATNLVRNRIEAPEAKAKPMT